MRDPMRHLAQWLAVYAKLTGTAMLCAAIFLILQAASQQIVVYQDEQVGGRNDRALRHLSLYTDPAEREEFYCDEPLLDLYERRSREYLPAKPAHSR